MNEKIPPLAMMVQVGERTFLGAQMGRPDLDEEYYDGGFFVDISVAFLEGMSEIKLYGVTSDGKAVYEPLTVQIQ